MDSYNKYLQEVNFFESMRRLRGLSETFEFSPMDGESLSAIAADSCFFTCAFIGMGYDYHIHYRNGYGVRVMKHWLADGAEFDCWELIVLRKNEQGEWVRAPYFTPYCDGCGYLRTSEVVHHCVDIRSLK